MLGFAPLGVFALGQATQSQSAAAEQVGSSIGWDPYRYKRRNKRRTKDEDVQQFLSEILGRFPEEAPAEIVAQAEAAKIAALEYNAIRDTALKAESAAVRERALNEINAFYAQLRADIKRRRELDDEEDEEFLLLLS